MKLRRRCFSILTWGADSFHRTLAHDLILTGMVTAILILLPSVRAQDQSGFYRPLTLAPADAGSSGGGAVEPNPWTFDASIYGLALGISGDLGIGPVTADLDVGLDDVLNNLEFGFMGLVRVGYGPWALTAEGLYMGLQGSKNNVTAEMDQWMVESAISYRVSRYIEPLIGFRYNHLSGELRGPGVLPTPRIPTGTQDWWDPIVGANLGLPLGKGFGLKLRGDVGGFGVGADLTWQVFPYLDWRFAQWGSVQAGYRWLYMDYETGSGASRFEYDMLNQGAQVGVTFHF